MKRTVTFVLAVAMIGSLFFAGFAGTAAATDGGDGGDAAVVQESTQSNTNVQAADSSADGLISDSSVAQQSDSVQVNANEQTGVAVAGDGGDGGDDIDVNISALLFG